MTDGYLRVGFRDFGRANVGGFAHVYIVRLKEKMKLGDGGVGDIACLKRVVAPDKEALGIVRTEVDTMVGILTKSMLRFRND